MQCMASSRIHQVQLLNSIQAPALDSQGELPGQVAQPTPHASPP